MANNYKNPLTVGIQAIPPPVRLVGASVDIAERRPLLIYNLCTSYFNNINAATRVVSALALGRPTKVLSQLPRATTYYLRFGDSI